jgi:hypothetical protein
LVELMQLPLEELLVRQRRLVFGNESGGDGAGQGVFDDFVILGCAEEDANGGAFMGLLHVAVEGFEVEFHLRASGDTLGGERTVRSKSAPAS